MIENFHLKAHKYIGVRFRHRGRTERGLDCIGLLVLTAKDCGYDIYKEIPYGREPKNAMMEAQFFEYLGNPVDKKPEVNDIVLMKLRPEAQPSHVGVITHHPHGLGIIHAYGEAGRVVHQRFSNKIANKVVGVYEWPERY